MPKSVRYVQKWWNGLLKSQPDMNQRLFVHIPKSASPVCSFVSGFISVFCSVFSLKGKTFGRCLHPLLSIPVNDLCLNRHTTLSRELVYKLVYKTL